MSYITSIATALPEHKYSSEEILAGARPWLSHNARAQELFERLLSGSQIATRHFAFPLERLFALRDAAERVPLFEERAAALAERAVREACAAADVSPDQLDYVITASCSIPVLPALDTLFLAALDCRPGIRRLPIYQHGCGAGAIGLSLAHALCAGGLKVLLVAVELCSLVYQPSDFGPGNLLGSILFGDGAAAVIVETASSGSLELVDSASFLIPASRGLMGYDIRADGNHLLLCKELPAVIGAHAPQFASRFLQRHGLAPPDVRWWLLHPGGARILQLLERELSLEREQTRWAWEVLNGCGNMSSASVLFVLERFLAERAFRPGERVLLLGIGPGIQLEAVLLQCR